MGKTSQNQKRLDPLETGPRIQICLDALDRAGIHYRRTGTEIRDLDLRYGADAFRREVLNPWGRRTLRIFTRDTAKKVAKALGPAFDRLGQDSQPTEFTWTHEENWDLGPPLAGKSLQVSWNDCKHPQYEDWLCITCSETLQGMSWKKLASQFLIPINGVQTDGQGILYDPKGQMAEYERTHVLRLSRKAPELLATYGRGQTHPVWGYYHTLAQYPEMIPEDSLHRKAFLQGHLEREDPSWISWNLGVLVESHPDPRGALNCLQEDGILEMAQHKVDLESLEKLISVGEPANWTQHWRAARCWLGPDSSTENEMKKDEAAWREKIPHLERLNRTSHYIASCETVLHEVLVQNNRNVADVHSKILEIENSRLADAALFVERESRRKASAEAARVKAAKAELADAEAELEKV